MEPISKEHMTMAAKPDVSTIAKTTIDQAQAAYEKANDATHESLQVFDAAGVAFKARFADIQMKSLEFTNANVA
jgi:hypothetical protein